MGKTNDRQARAARAEAMRIEREKADRRQRRLLTVAIVGAVVVLIAAAAFAISRAGGSDGPVVAPAGTTNDYGIAFTTQDAGGTVPAGVDPVTVVLYEDFQCPICATFEQQVAPALVDRVAQGEITIEYRPISFLDRQSENEYSTRSLNASLCVLDQGGITAWKTFHDLLFASQPPEGTAGPEDPALIDTAADAGVTGIDACVETERFGPWIDAAYDQATDDGFPGTPWVVIDGETIENPTLENIQAAIDAAA